MKPLVEKILKAGLVDKNTAKMFERWGVLSPEDTEMVSKERLKITRETLQEFAEQISELLEAEPILKETRLEVAVERPVRLFNRDFGHVHAMEDSLGRFIVDSKYKFKPGTLFTVHKEVDGELLQGTVRANDVEEIYDGDKLVGLQITV